MRGSGDHHRTGSGAEYQGNTPLRYACSRRSTERSPPAASRPLGFFRARSTGGKGSVLFIHVSTASLTPYLLATIVLERLHDAGRTRGVACRVAMLELQ